MDTNCFALLWLTDAKFGCRSNYPLRGEFSLTVLFLLVASNDNATSLQREFVMKVSALKGKSLYAPLEFNSDK